METQIFFSDVSDIDYNFYFDLMPRDRQERTKKLRFEKDKKLSAGAWGLLQKVLEINKIKNPKFYKNEQGKIYCDKKNFYFNLSHSGSMVMCAVSEKEIGCDTEEIKLVKEKLAERFFAPGEQKAIKTDRDFYRIWTLKESFIKCLGTGLSTPLQSFEILLKNPPEINQKINEKKYFFREFFVDENYCFSACGEAEIPEEITKIIL